jgi:hypothetical protein
VQGWKKYGPRRNLSFIELYLLLLNDNIVAKVKNNYFDGNASFGVPSRGRIPNLGSFFARSLQKKKTNSTAVK